ncbi:MAG: DUF58 domain-containing protein [Defluviitaleaceae bacterium]|nr:DUF58 domain-containing protein [Defluviitaleaceae bacterium]
MVKNRLTYLLVIVVIILLVYLYEHTATYVALYALLALPLLSLGLALLTRKRLDVVQKVEQQTIVKGDTTQYTLVVGNRSVMPIASVRAKFKASSDAIEADFEEHYFSLPARGSSDVVFNITAKYRGNFEIGLANIVLYDFLGLFAFKQHFGEIVMLEVRPRVIDMDDLPLALAQGGIDGTQNLLQQEDYAVIADLRKYQPTDGYKKIHWKASAKKSELISKNFQSFKRSATTFIIDNSKISGLNPSLMEDMMMEACVSIMSQAISRNQICQLIYLGMDQDLQEHTSNFEFLYGQACGIRFDHFAPKDFEVRFASFFNVQSDVENMVVIVKKVTEGTLTSVQNLRMFGCNVILVYLEEPRKEQQEKIEALRDMDVFCLDFRRYYYG